MNAFNQFAMRFQIAIKHPYEYQTHETKEIRQAAWKDPNRFMQAYTIALTWVGQNQENSTYSDIKFLQ